MKGAPIWNFFKQMNTFLPSGLPDSEFVTCLEKGCFKVVRIVRQTATAMIMHLADEHVRLHDLYIENHRKSAKELRELKKECQAEEEQSTKMEKANKLAQQGSGSNQKTNIQSISIESSQFLFSEDKRQIFEEENITKEFEDFSNSNSTIREYFVPIGMLYAKCKTCHLTLSIQVSKIIFQIITPLN